MVHLGRQRSARHVTASGEALLLHGTSRSAAIVVHLGRQRSSRHGPAAGCFIEIISRKSWQRSRLGMFHRDFFTKVLAAIAARNVSSRFFHESPGSDRGSERFIEIFSRKSWQRSRLVVTPCRVQGDAGRPEIPPQSARDLEQECSHKGPRHVQAPPEIAQTQASSWRSLLLHRMSRSAATGPAATVIFAQPRFRRR